MPIDRTVSTKQGQRRRSADFLATFVGRQRGDCVILDLASRFEATRQACLVTVPAGAGAAMSTRLAHHHLGEPSMKQSIGVLLLLAVGQGSIDLAHGQGQGPYQVSGAVVVGGGYGYGARGGYYGYRGGYYGPGWRPYGAGVGVYLGAPLGGGWPWGPPAYYPPPVVYPPLVVVPPAPVYVEKGEAAAPSTYDGGDSLEPGYWYYCKDSGAYYPAVTQCSSPWDKVAPVTN